MGAALLALATIGAATPERTMSAPTTVAPTPTRRVWPTATLGPTPTAVLPPPPLFGRIVYKASRAGSYESLGVPVIACRHRDPGPRKISVEFFDRLGKKVMIFGADTLPNVPPGKKVIFASEAGHLRNRDAVIVRVGHFSDGTARVVSDARIIHCIARMQFDPGALAPTYWRSMGLYREGTGATPVPVQW